MSWSSQQYKYEFRNAAAGLIKSIIRARLRQQPNFLSKREISRWRFDFDVTTDTRDCATHLISVRRLRGNFEEKYLGGQNSIPAPDVGDVEDGFDELMDQVATFIYCDLDFAIRQASRGAQVDWDELARWDRLSCIREMLDRLPEAPPPLDVTEAPKLPRGRQPDPDKPKRDEHIRRLCKDNPNLTDREIAELAKNDKEILTLNSRKKITTHIVFNARHRR